MRCKSNKDGKDQESIQSSTTPDPRYQMKSNKITINITNKSQDASPFHSGDLVNIVANATKIHLTKVAKSRAEIYTGSIFVLFDID